MAEKIIMPKAGMAMETGTIIRWLKNVGDHVEKGEPVLEIETDKLAMEIEAETSGILLSTLYTAGEVIPVVQTIGWIGEPGETVPEQETTTDSVIVQRVPSYDKSLSTQMPVAGERVPATPAAKTLARQQGVDLITVASSGQYGEIKRRDIEQYLENERPIVNPAGPVLHVSPLAKRMADAKQIHLQQITGSGKHGKIVSRDVTDAIDRRELQTPPVGEIRRRKALVPQETLKGIRKIIAQRMSESHATVPSATLHIKVNADKLVDLREQVNGAYGLKITFNDFVLRATSLALAEFPELNARICGQEVTYNNRVHVALAVATNRGLLVPVIRDADTLSLKELSAQSADLVARTRSGKVTPDELTGGTFTVTNLGMYGITMFTPIINIPEVAILGVCAIEDVVTLEQGRFVAGKSMGLCLTHDHRLIDGSLAALFLNRIRSLLELPFTLLG